jgi:hypothetical protein
MRELRSCDFCGGDAAGVYEPLPPDLVDDQRRAALCPDCRATLADLLDPLRPSEERDAPNADGDADRPTADRTDGADPGDCAVTVEPAAGADADAERDGAATDAGTERAVESEDGADEAPADRSGGRPRGYRKLIRLVSNREDAVSRADLTEVAQSAYGIDPAQAETALEAAVANGDLIADGDRLRVPER